MKEYIITVVCSMILSAVILYVIVYITGINIIIVR